jgi:hypothetical protein
MADDKTYTVPTRVNYFNSQMLYDDDFKAEQDYHRTMRLLHNSSLHTWGIVSGLEVKNGSKGNEVVIGKGMAIDNQGREIVLVKDTPYPFSERGVKRYLTITYKDKEDEDSVKLDIAGKKDAYARQEESPEIKAQAEEPPPPKDGEAIVLAKVELGEFGNVSKIDDTARSRFAGLNPNTELSVRSLLVEGKVGIGTPSPGAKLEVGGTLTASANDEALVGLKIAPTFDNASKTGVKRYGLDISGIANTVGQVSLQLRSGNTATNYDSNQITLGYDNTAQYRHAIKTRHHSGRKSCNAIDFYVWNYSTETGAADIIGGLHTLTLDGGNVGIGTTNPGARLEVAGTLTATQNDEALVGLKITPTFQDSGKTGVKHYGLIVADGNVGIGTTAPASKLHIDKGRVDITTSDVTGGGQNRFDGLRGWNAETSYRRGQLVLSSSYSDLVIASSHANDLHGSTLTLATYNPTNTNEYRKWVINQGNWGARKQFLDFGYSDEGRANPHLNINDTDTVLTLDGVNKQVGIGARSPRAKLEVAVAGDDGTTTPLAIGKGTTNYLTMLNDGNVGIGKSDPSAKLEVAGEIKFSGKGLKTDALGLITPFYLRGTGLENNKARTLIIGSTKLYDIAGGRGLTLTIINKSDHEPVSIKTYDTFGNREDVKSLATALNGIQNTHIGILASYDAWEEGISEDLRTALRRVGLFKAAVSPTGNYRRPYAAIFEASSSSTEGTAKAVEVLYRSGRTAPYAEIRGWLIDGSFIATGSAPNALTDIHGDPVVIVSESGSFSERLTVVTVNTTDANVNWDNATHPILQHFRSCLMGKPVGTVMRAILKGSKYTDRIFRGWVDADNKIRVCHTWHPGQIVP